MSSDLDAALRDVVETFVVQLRELFQRSALEKVQSALGGEAPAPRRGRPPKAAASAGRARKKGAKRTPEELEALTKSLLGAIKKGPGRRIEEIGKEMGVPTKELALPVAKLFEAKAIKSTGQRRATKYFPK